MAADYKQMEQNLRQFYDFSGKAVLAVGAGGLFFDVIGKAKRLTVIDKDPATIRQWEARIVADGLEGRVDVIHADFCVRSPRGDVVYFEFSLHEMDDPVQALRHALTLAPEVLVFDHLPDSEWAFHAAEEDKIQRSTDTLADFNCVRRQSFCTEQRFKSYQEFVDKVASQGAVALERAQRYRDAGEIAIPMTYGASLLVGEPCHGVAPA